MLPSPTRSTLFPYTTLFRSLTRRSDAGEARLGRGSADGRGRDRPAIRAPSTDRKSTRLNSSHTVISYAVFCLKKKKTNGRHQFHEEHSKRRPLECSVDPTMG